MRTDVCVKHCCSTLAHHFHHDGRTAANSAMALPLADLHPCAAPTRAAAVLCTNMAKAEKDAAYNQRMAQQDVYKHAKEAKAAANKRKQAEILEMRSKLDPARKRTRRGRGKGPRVSHQQVDP